MPVAPASNIKDPVAVFLDFDGTLVNIAERPDLVQVPPTLLTMIQQVHDRLDGALAVITGRPIADLDALLAPLQLPVAGVHGMEHRDESGVLRSTGSTSIPEAVRKRLKGLAAMDAALVLEDKGSCLTLHYRQSPSRETLIRSEMQEIYSELGQDFMLQDGKMLLELRPTGATKGTAVSEFMARPPFAGRLPIFIGDDITDEDAFRVVNQMQGYSIRVGPTDPDSAAQYALPDVEAVRDWLSLLTKHPLD